MTKLGLRAVPEVAEESKQVVSIKPDEVCSCSTLVSTVKRYVI